MKNLPKRIYGFLLAVALLLSPMGTFSSSGAQAAAANRYNVVFVIDASSSMLETDHSLWRYEAIDLFLGLATDAGNHMGAVIFNDRIIAAIQMQEINGKDIKTTFSQNLRNSPIQGDTDIGGAVLKAVVDFQYEVATRKYTNLLAKEMDRREVQEGLIKACNVIDLIIEILRGSKDRNMAKACLTEGKTTGIKFKSKESKIMAAQLAFTERQANAILEMRLYKLIGLEIEALLKEHDETTANIYRYEDILERRDSMAQVIINELDNYKKEYGRKRRTVIENAQEAVYKEKEVEEMEIVFLMDRFGYAKTVEQSVYERNKEAADAENKFVFTCKNIGKICLFTSTGQLHTIKVMDLPFGKFREKGTPIDNVSNFNSEKETVVCITGQTELNLRQVAFVTAQGMCKLVDGGEFDVSKRTVAATKLGEGDTVVSVMPLVEQHQVVLQSRNGYFLKFPIEEIPEKKKAALGVRGMKLGKEDLVENVYYLSPGEEVTIEYKEHPILLHSLKTAARDGKGSRK